MLAPAIWVALGLLAGVGLTLVLTVQHWIRHAVDDPSDVLDLTPFIGDLDDQLEQLLDQGA